MPEAARPAAVDVVLGFDFGTRRIGVAAGSTLSGQAQALTALVCRGAPDWQAIRRLVADWQPRALIVGLPLREDGSEQPITARARAFMAELHAAFGLPVHATDERFSSTEANARLRGARATGSRRRRLQKGDTDAMAAQVIVETWLASPPNAPLHDRR